MNKQKIYFTSYIIIAILIIFSIGFTIGKFSVVIPEVPVCPDCVCDCQEFNYSLISLEVGSGIDNGEGFLLTNSSVPEPSIIWLDEQTYITDSETHVIPEYTGDFKAEKPSEVIEEWDCEHQEEFLFDYENYVYRVDWFDSMKRGNPENACKSKSHYLAHYELTGVFPVDLAGHEQDQFQILKCWYEDCY